MSEQVLPGSGRSELPMSSHAQASREPAPHERGQRPGYEMGRRAGEVMSALVVEDSPQIAERLVELVSIPDRVEVVATAATEDEALAACDSHSIGLAIVDL